MTRRARRPGDLECGEPAGGATWATTLSSPTPPTARQGVTSGPWSASTQRQGPPLPPGPARAAGRFAAARPPRAAAPPVPGPAGSRAPRVAGPCKGALAAPPAAVPGMPGEAPGHAAGARAHVTPCGRAPRATRGACGGPPTPQRRRARGTPRSARPTRQTLPTGRDRQRRAPASPVPSPHGGPARARRHLCHSLTAA